MSFILIFKPEIRLYLQVCGGDVEPAIWHIGSRSLASALVCERPLLMRYTVAKMNDNRILVGGSCSDLMQVSNMELNDEKWFSRRFRMIGRKYAIVVMLI